MEISYGAKTSEARNLARENAKKRYEAPAVRHEDIYEDMFLACIVLASMSGGDSTCQG